MMSNQPTKEKKMKASELIEVVRNKTKDGKQFQSLDVALV